MKPVIQNLEFKNSTGDTACVLKYTPKPVEMKAKRFADRWYYEPEIDLGLVDGKLIYECKAVIDYIHVQFEHKKPTQSQAMSKAVRDIGQRRPGFPNNEWKFSSTTITLVFQEPTRQSLKDAILAIHAKQKLASIPKIVEMEVSLDFYSAAQSDEELARMYAVLMRHIVPPRRMLSEKRDRPRFVYPKAGQEMLPKPKTNFKFLTTLKEIPLQPDDTLLRALSNRRKFPDNHPFNNSTFYIGSKDANAKIRAMNKVRDTQRDEITFTADDGTETIVPTKKRINNNLEIKDCRARIEVTLKGTELKLLGKQKKETDVDGIDKMPDLWKFSFGKLQGAYFNFRHPTFLPNNTPPHLAGVAKATPENINYEMQELFMKSGTIPVFETQQAFQHTLENPRKRGEDRGRPRKADRQWFEEISKGGTLIGYSALNKKARDALDKLSKDWR